MADLNQMELQNLRHLIGAQQTPPKTFVFIILQRKHIVNTKTQKNSSKKKSAIEGIEQR